MDFVPLKIQTRFSPLLSAIEPGALAGLLARAGIRAAGIADRGVLFGAAGARDAFREEGIVLAAGAEVAVWFPRPGGDLLPSAYTLTLFPESGEGLLNLDRLLERIMREGRPPRLCGVADFGELEEFAGGLLCLSGGLTGPVSGSWARGRAGDALRATRRLADLFGTSRLFLETSRCGASKEELVEPFLRELGARFGLRRVAADPIRFTKPAERFLLARLRSLGPRSLGEGPPDPFPADGDGCIRPMEEMARRYGEDLEPLRTASEIALRAAAFLSTPSDPGEGGETDELIRVAIAEANRRAEWSPHWRRKEAEARFWAEFWAIDDPRLHRAALHLSRLFRMVRRAQPEALVSTPFLSGTLVGWLSGLQEIDPEEAGTSHPVQGCRHGRIVIEADCESAELLGRLLVDRLPGRVFPAIVPRSLNAAVKEKAFASPIRLSREGSGPDPHPPTANPSGPGDRGNRSPDPLSEAEARGIVEGAIAGYERDARELVWAGETDDVWGLDARTGGALRLRVRESSLLTVIRAGRSIEGEGNPYDVIRRGEWTGILEGGLSLSRDLTAAAQPRSESDLSLLLAAGADRGPRRDLVERIVAVRAGKRPAPVRIPRLAPILRETDGVPFFQEQMVEMIRNLAACSRRIAETLFRDLRASAGPRLARERSLFVRRAADRGIEPVVAHKAFSLLIALAPHAPCRGEVLPYARRVLRAAGLKSADPHAFAAAALNGCLDDRKRLHSLWAGFRREGVRFLTLDRNASVFEFRVEDGSLRVGLGALTGMTREIGDRIVEEREANGPFAGDADLLQRLAALRIPRAVLEEAARALSEGAPATEPVQGFSVREGGMLVSGFGVVTPRTGGRRPPTPRARGMRGRAQTAFSFLKGKEAVHKKGRAPRPLFESREET